MQKKKIMLKIKLKEKLGFNIDILDHFSRVGKMVELGLGSQR